MCEKKEEKKYRLVNCKLGRCCMGGTIHHYLTLTFGGKEEDGYYEIIIPKVMLPISADMEPIISSDDIHGKMFLYTGGHNFPIEPVYDHEDHFHRVDFKGNDVPFKGNRVLKVKIKDIPVKEMTMEEIEKELGYRVKIVKEK